MYFVNKPGKTESILVQLFYKIVHNQNCLKAQYFIAPLWETFFYLETVSTKWYKFQSFVINACPLNLKVNLRHIFWFLCIFLQTAAFWQKTAALRRATQSKKVGTKQWGGVPLSVPFPNLGTGTGRVRTPFPYIWKCFFRRSRGASFLTFFSPKSGLSK